MNPETNKFEHLIEAQKQLEDLLFKVAYIGESTLLFEPVGPVIIEETST
jgi:hypothetical protein